MSRRLKLQLRAGKVLFKEVCRKAAEAFSEGRLRDALALYEGFAKEHPDAHTDEIQLRARALREYIERHVERPQGASPPPHPRSGSDSGGSAACQGFEARPDLPLGSIGGGPPASAVVFSARFLRHGSGRRQHGQFESVPPEM